MRHLNSLRQLLAASRPARLFCGVVVVAILLLWGFLGWDSYALHRQAHADGARTLSLLRVSITEQVRHDVQATDLMLTSLQRAMQGERRREYGSAAEGHLLLAGHAAGLSFVNNAVLINSKGDSVATSLSPENKRINVADRDYFRHFAEHPENSLFISKPVSGRISKRPVILLARPLLKEGVFDGLIVVSVDTGYFVDLMQRQLPLPGIAGSVFRKDGILMARFPEATEAVGQDYSQIELFRSHLKRHPEGSYRTVGAIDGLARSFSYGSLGTHPFVVVVSQADGELFMPWRNATSKLLGIGGVGTLLLLLLSIGVLREMKEVQDGAVALQSSELRFRAIFDNINDAIFIHDIKTGAIVAVNRRMCEMYGYDNSAVGCLTVADLSEGNPPYSINEALAYLEKAAAGTPQIFEWRARHHSGDLFWVEVSIRRARIGASEECLLVVVRDISERKHDEQEILLLNRSLEQRVRDRTEELEQANRELESFSYSVSHDLRSPLRAINGYASILEEDERANLTPAGADMLDRIARSAVKLGELIDDILDYSRAGRLPLQRVDIDLAALCAEVAGEQRELHPRAVISIAPLPVVQGDATLLRLVLQNLIDNACKFSSKQERPQVVVGSREEGVETVFFVQDNGAGFDMRYADKLFGMFQRMHTGSDFSGSGVGLAIVKRLIERQGGRVWASAEPGGGATFCFTLGAAESVVAPASSVA